MKIALPLLTAFTGLAALSTATIAQTTGQEDEARRVARVFVYGNDPCPRGTGNEIIVCARRPETERYRIRNYEGERLRDGESWASRAESLETMGETGIQSCSTVGPGGHTGCWEEMMRQHRRDRRANANNTPNR